MFTKDDVPYAAFDSVVNAFNSVGGYAVSTTDILKGLQLAAQKGVQILPKEEKETKVDINLVNINPDDVIIITFDLDQCEIDKCHQIMETYHKTFPNNIILANLFPLVKSINIVSPADKESKREDEISW